MIRGMETVQAGIMAAVLSFVLAQLLLKGITLRTRAIKPLPNDAIALLAGTHLVVGLAVATLYGTVNDVSTSIIATVVLAVWLLSLCVLQITTMLCRIPRPVFITVSAYWLVTLAAAGVSLSVILG